MDLESLPTSWVITSLATVCSDIKQKTPALDEQLTYIDIASIDRHLKVITEPQLLIGKNAPSRARKIGSCTIRFESYLARYFGVGSILLRSYARLRNIHTH